MNVVLRTLAIAIAAGLAARSALAQGLPIPKDPRAALAVREDEVPSRFALALCTAMGGDFEGAITELGACKPTDDVAKQRVDTELARMRAWVELRDRWLADMLRSKQPLKIEFGGKKLSAPIAALANGEIELAPPNAATRIPVRALDPIQIAPFVKSLVADEREWLAIYPYCVTGNAKAKRVGVTHESAELTALRTDADAFYPNAFRAGKALQDLAHILEGAWPPTPAAAKPKLEQLGALWKAQHEVNCIAARSQALRSLAEAYLVVLANELGAKDFVHVPVEDKGDGRVRIAYRFDVAGELDDFLPDDDNMKSRHINRAPLVVTPEQAGPAIHEGDLQIAGAQCRRHMLEFEAPMTVRYTARWIALEDTPKDEMVFCVGMCGDTMGHNIRVQSIIGLWVNEKRQGESSIELKGNHIIDENVNYAIELRHDGKKVEAWINGNDVGELPTGERRAGRVFLWAHSNLRIAISDFEIDGKVVPASLDACRRDWIERRLADLGWPR
jgi:hypothetical protein